MKFGSKKKQWYPAQNRAYVKITTGNLRILFECLSLKNVLRVKNINKDII